MKRLLRLAALVAALAPAWAHAGTITVGIGAFAGTSIPVVQDDVKSGALYGVRVPVNLIKLVTVEPYFARTALGDAKAAVDGFTYTRSGFDVTAFGANALLGSPGGPGFHFYPYVGIGSHKLTRTGSEDLTEVGYNFGIGLGLSPVPGLSVQARGELNMVVTGDTSRKFGNATLGLSYNLLRGLP
jgi:hypothetical protein